MTDDKTTDPYDGELSTDADLGSSDAVPNDDDSAADDIAAALPSDERMAKPDDPAPRV